MSPRVVLDTNVLLDWLVFRDPRSARLIGAITGGRITVFTNAACTAELERVLAYPQLGLDDARQADALAIFGAHVLTHSGPARPGFLPPCRDPDDQKFLELARDAEAGYLLTKDKALLDLARPRRRLGGFRILHPDRFED